MVFNPGVTKAEEFHFTNKLDSLKYYSRLLTPVVKFHIMDMQGALRN